eukprot:CAMPEP_0170559604 /NCGR_PEP_ID=MMETSP0211-20121228/43928_1 /TAXON_ID=311385 /ORGANISM="Pseudokeronopsis sp., Strain OXSARD2" /LENGTH=194 /DNA_ID=CAMNT_0010872837 /DNA_START=596 /DNA_END=1180 /DNA_ORIENTATION=-
MNNTSLNFLSMNECYLEEEGAYYICQGLLKNRSLKTLLLSTNNLCDEGIVNFADVISFFSFALENLDLSNNFITDKGAVKFAKQLRKNQNFLSINLSQNTLKNDSGQAFREAAAEHYRLEKLNLESNSISMKDIEEINKLLKRNKDNSYKRKKPFFENELRLLIVNSKQTELNETMKMVETLADNKSTIIEKNA